MATQFACLFAFISFATMLMKGMFDGSTFRETINSGLAALVSCYLVGWLTGEIARRVVEESVQLELKPTPTTNSDSPDATLTEQDLSPSENQTSIPGQT